MSLTQEPAHRDRRRNRGLIALVPAIAAAVTATVLLVIPASAADSSISKWTTCSDTFKCADLTVPLDWNNPNGGTIKLKVMKRPAGDKANRIGTLIVNPGGPGTLGADSGLLNGFDSDIAKRFDIIGFDPRGVGQSGSIQCSNELVLTMRAASSWPITSQAQFDERKRLSKLMLDSCKKNTDSSQTAVITNADTLSTVKDIDKLRDLLGESKISFYGISYGTLMAQQYAETYPDRVRGIVSDSNMDHSLDAAGWFASSAQVMQDFVDSFVQGCGSDKQCRSLLGSGIKDAKGVRGFVDKLWARADLGDLSSSGVATVGDLVSRVGNLFQQGSNWQSMATMLKGLADNAKSGGTKPTAPDTSNVMPDITGSRAFVMQATMCQDWDLHISDYTQWSQLHEAAKTANVPAVPTADLRASYCLAWDGPVNNPPHKIVAKNANPMLLVNSRYDGDTGYRWAQSLAKQFGDRAFLLTYDGSGHDVSGRHVPCVDTAIKAYLLAGTLPSDGHCAAV